MPAGGAPYIGCRTHHATADIIVTRYANNTQVPNYVIGGANIAVYERWNNDETLPTCATAPSCVTNGVPCEAWIGTDQNSVSTQYTMIAGQVNTAPQTWAQNGTENFAVCHKRGWKSVHARRHWHGVVGWTSADYTDPATVLLCSYELTDCNSVNPGGTGYIPTYASSPYVPYAPSPDQVRYRTCAWSVTYDFISSWDSYFFGNNDEYSCTASGSRTVDANSGEKTNGVSTAEVDTHSVVSGGTTTTTTTANIVNGYDSVAGSYGHTSRTDAVVGMDFHNSLPIIQDGEYAGKSLAEAIDYWNTYEMTALCATPTYDAHFFNPITDNNSFSTQTVTRVTTTVTSSLTVFWHRTATVFTWNFEFKQWDNITGGVGNDVKFSGTVTLSDPSKPNYTASGNYDVMADINGLLANWPLNDDSLIPWRTDNDTTLCPLVSRLEVDGDRSPIGFDMYYVQKPNSTTWVAWFDTAIYEWQWAAGADPTSAAPTGLVKFLDGSPQGLPKAVGYTGYFRFDFNEWRACCASGNVRWYVQGYGQSQPPALPGTATQWPNFWQRMNKPCVGPLLAYNDANTTGNSSCTYLGTADTAIYAIKWAECGETYESINCARPAGADKFLIDETTCRCNGGLSGSTLTLIDSDNNPLTSNPFTTADIVGGASIGGFYAVSSVATSSINLGTKMFNCPAGWDTNSYDGSSVISKLRFPSCPSLLGRIGIVAVADAGSHAPYSAGWTPTYQFPSAQVNFGMAVAGTESVDIYDASMTKLVAGATATRVDDTKFILDAGYSTAVWVMIHGCTCSPATGSQHYEFCDDYPKGDYVYCEWTVDWRTNAERTRLLGATDCAGNTPPTDIPAANSGYSLASQTKDSLPLCVKSPRVVCFSPNEEAWSNGITYPFPTLPLDGIYGSKWQAQVVWSITDPFWQTPHEPCGHGIAWSGTWTEDDGSCNVDTNDLRYYQLAPMVEARLTVPAGFPALASGVTPLGGANSPPPVTGYQDNGTPSQPVTPWGTQIILCNTVAGTCNHTPAFPYANWVLGC